MNPITEILLRLALFEGLALLILGSVLLCRRLSDQPLERIRMTQFGLLAVAVALLFTFTSILPGRLHIPLSNAEHVPAQQELMPEALLETLPEPAGETVFLADIVERTDIEIQSPFVPVAMKRPESELSFSSQEFPISSPVEVETQAAMALPELVAATTAPVPSQPEARFSLSLGVILLGLFGLPTLLLLAWNIAARSKLHGILKRSEPVFEFVQNIFRSVQDKSKYRVDLRMSGGIDTPMVFGLFRPVLLLPSALCERSRNSDTELRACLAHEWSHLRRGDLLTWNIVRLFQYPLWMQPFYWMLRSRLLADQDFLADDDGARSLSDRTDYADILLAMARDRLSSPPQNVLGMAGRKSQLSRRIEMLFNTEQNLMQTSRKRKLLLPFIFLTSLVLFGGTLRFGEKTVATELAASETVAKTENVSHEVQVTETTPQPLSMTKGKNEFEISGKVYDIDGKPATGVAVVSYEDERTEASRPVITDENGSFTLKGKKTFGIQASSKDGRKFFLHLISGDQLPVARLQAAKELTGQVVDKVGKPVAGATVGMYTVRRRNYFAESDADGRFTIYYPQNVPAILSVFAFKFQAGFDYRLFGSEDGVLDANQPNIDWSKPFTMTLTGAAPIRLNVRWDDGSPATGVTVTPWTFQNPNHPRMQASPAFGNPSFNFAFLQYFNRKKVDADGIVEFDWMPDWVSRMTFFYILGPWEGDEVLKRIEFRTPENGPREKTAVLYRPRKASGVVRFPDGKPAEGITVKCEGVDLKYDYKRFKTKTDANGRYEIALDTEVAYVLGVENDDWGAAPVNPLVVNSKTKPEELQNLDFTLQKTVQVRGNVVFGPKKEHLKGLKISFSITGKTDLDLPKEKQLAPVEGRERRRGDEEGCGGPDLRYYLWLGNAPIDDNGHFSKRLGPGEYSIGISENYIGRAGFVRGLLPDDAKIIVPEDAGEEIVLNLEAEASGNGRLRGKVLLSDGAPAVGAKLLGAFHSNGRTIDSLTPDFKAETDAEGNFDGARTLEPVWLFVQNADGSQRALLSLDENTQTLDEPIRLQTLGNVTGRVVDFHGNAIPNIEIFYGVPVYGLFGYDDWHDKQQDFPPRIRSQLRFGASVKADKDGIFAIDSIIIGEDFYIAYAAAKNDQRNGNDTFQIAKVRLEKSDEKLDLGDCRVNPASMEGWKAPEPETLSKFTARFLDDKTEKPLVKQKIDIGWAKIQPEEEPQQTAPGVFARTWPPNENRPFTGEHPVTDEDGKIEFSLPVQATVYDPKQIELQVSCFRSLPGGSGPDAWNKIPYVMLYETISGPFTENRDFTFRMIPYPTVLGKVVDPEGKPIAGASLRLATSRRPKPGDIKRISAHKEFGTTTDADGMFRSMIAPDFDNGTMQCNAPGFVPCVFQLEDSDPEKIDDWTFTVQKGIDVSGRLTDPEGKGVAGLWVNFERSTTGGKALAGKVYAVINDELGRSVRSDAEGRFVVSSLDEEEYAVSVTPMPCCPNAENAERVRRYDRPPMLEKYVFVHRKIDLRKTEGEPATPKPPLEIVGYPTVAIKVELVDETNNRSAFSYSRFSFHGRLSDGKENWSVQAETKTDPRDRNKAGAVVHLPKGASASLSGSLVGSHINENGVGDILHERQNWTLEYRFGPDTEWKSCKESVVSGDSIYQHVAGELGVILDETPTLEIRIR